MRYGAKTRVTSTDCGVLVKEVTNQLKALGYSSATLGMYGWVWKKFLKFAGNKPFSERLVKQFLRSEGVLAEALDSCGLGSGRPYIITPMRILHQYACGTPLPLKRKRSVASPIQLPDDMQNALSRYQRYCTDQRRVKGSTLNGHMNQVRKFLCFASDRVGDIKDLRSQHVSDFIKLKRGMSPKTVAAHICILKSFLRFLWVSEVVPEDLSPTLPKIRIPEHSHIPPVWNQEQVKALLSVIDRTSARGKRNYAILLLACRLGLRSKDIRKLTLENLRWAESRIEITQSKNGRILTLPLLDDVGDALIDYLRNGRPDYGFREVFLSVRSPFRPIGNGSNLAHMMRCYLKRAGISMSAHRCVGLHSLRHTLATRMLESNVALPTISEVMGHKSTESTLIYTKVDISALRSASLDPDSMISKEVCHD